MAKPKGLVVLTTAPDQVTAGMWQDILSQQGIPAMINPEDDVSFLGVSNIPCRIMVLPADLERAQAVLASLKPEEEK
jgi:uncharacterized small protein (DUF1192 family)